MRRATRRAVRTRASARRPTQWHRSRTRPQRRSQERGALDGPVAPPRQFLLVTERLLPAEDGQAGEQSERELPIEPAARRDAMTFERRAEEADRVLLRL